MKPMAAFTDLAVANVASTDFCSGGANADNPFQGHKTMAVVVHSSSDV